MNNLPVEVLLNVFSFVPKEELVTTIPQVCRRWKDVAADPSLFRTLDLVSDDPDTRTSIRLLSTATWLTSLKLYGRSDTDVLIQHIGVNHLRLVKLVIEKCRGSRSKEDVSAMQLRYLVRRCTTLQQFSLKRTLCNSKLLQTEIAENLRDLRDMTITISPNVDTKALISITNNCSAIEKIYYFSVIRDTFSANVVANFCDKFKESLTSIRIVNTAWTNTSLASLSRCRNVKKLGLYIFGNITDEGIMSICEMSKLEFLVISQTGGMTSAGLVRLFENPSMESLVELHLLVVDDLVAIAISLLPNLTNLLILVSFFSDEGLLSLSNIPNLSHLTINYNTSITSHGWIRFFQTNNVRQKITHLSLLHCNNLNLEVAKEIVQGLRKLQQLELSR